MTQISNAEKQARFRKKEQLKREADKIFNLWVGSPMRYRFSKRSEAEVRQALEEAVELPPDWKEEDYEYAKRKLGQYHLDLISSVDQIANDIDGDRVSYLAELDKSSNPFKFHKDNKAAIEDAWALASHIISALKISNCNDVGRAAVLLEAVRFVGRSLISNREIHCSQATAICLASVGPHFDRPEWFPEKLAETIRQQIGDSLANEVEQHLSKASHHPMKASNNSSLLAEFRSIATELNASLPKEVPLGISRSIDPIRALILREACLHRIAEIVRAAYDAFARDDLVVAIILSRSIIETVALFWDFIAKLKAALASRNIEEIRSFLSGCLVGVKSPKLKEFKSPSQPDLIVTPVNILTLIDKLDKDVTHFRLNYDSMSEFSHPNAAGTVDAYVVLDWDAGVARLGSNRTKLVPELALPQLVGTLTAFIIQYNHAAELLEKFVPLCESLLDGIPSKKKESGEKVNSSS
jgi:hypothetical protein